MPKPVEIEFLMRDKLSGGLDAAGKSAEALGDRVERVSQSITERIAAQREQVRYVEQCLKDLKRQYDKLSPGKAQTEMRAEIEACTRALDEDKATLAGLRSEHEKNSATARGLTMELRQLLGTMAQMRLEGRQNSQEYQAMAKRAALLQDALGDLRTQTKILAHDNSGLQGLMSGVSGVAGAFTMATGIVGAFASENENLIKIQTRVQSVLAITMGLQQVMNALNKDSAFRLVTVVKMKNLLTAANTRLAAALGISNAAASALMATLTLGLSAVITGLIVLWDRYSDSQEEAAAKAKERGEIEKDGRAQMIKSRFEIESTLKSLKEFTGTKEQEKAKVEELNRKYGESFGYYDTIAQWYDVLLEKGEAYIQMLFLQAKVQSLINKATEADEAVNTLQSTPANEVEGAHGWWYRFFAKSGAAEAGFDIREIDAQIDQSNEQIKAKLVEAAQEQRDAYLDEAKKVMEDMAEIGKESGLGGFIKPKKETIAPDKLTNNLVDYEARAQRKIEDTRVALMEKGFEKERAVARNAFEQEKVRIDKEEQERLQLYERLRKAGAQVTPEQKSAIIAQAAAQRVQAAQMLDNALSEIDAKEQKDAADQKQKTEKKLSDLLAKYQDYEAQRAQVIKQGNADIAALEEQRTEANSQEIDRAIAVARQKIEEGVRSINDVEAASITKDNGFLKQLFGDYSSMSFGKLRDLISQAKQLQSYLNGNGSAEGITFISSDELKNIEKSPAELDKLRKALDKLLDTGKRGGGSKWENIFKDFQKGFAELDGAKNFEDISGAIGTISGAASDAAGELAAMFDEMGDTQTADAISGVQQVMGAVSNIGQGFAKGDIIGGIGATIGEAANFIGQVFTAQARHQEALKEIERAKLDFQRQYNLALLEQNLLLEEATNIFGERQIMKAANAVNVYRDALARFNAEMKGNAPKMNSFEGWTNDFYGSYAEKMAQYEAGIYGLASAQIVTGHKKTGLFGWGKGKDVYSSILAAYPELIDANGELDTAMLQTILDTRKMSDETRKYLENLIELKDAMDEAEQALEDYLSNTFGSLGGRVIECVKDMAKGVTSVYADMRDDIAAILEDLGEQVVYSLFFADKFDKLQEDLKAIYGSGKDEEDIASDAMDLLAGFYSGLGSNMDAAQGWMEEFQKRAEEAGFDLWKPDSATQSGKAGTLTTITQDQGTKLEGLMTSMQMHEASMDENLENIAEGMGAALDSLRQIKENTDVLPLIYALWLAIKRDGLKVK